MLILVVVVICALPASRRASYAPVVPTHPAVLAVAINPNTDPWWKLASLPRIGKSRALQIIAARHEDGTPAFRIPADLEQVHGIGPATVQAIAPYLVFEGELSGPP